MDKPTEKEKAIIILAERIWDSDMYGDNEKTGLTLPLWVIRLCKTALEQMQTELCQLIPDTETDTWKCSKCGNEMVFESDPREYVNYCWNCGGKVEK